MANDNWRVRLVRFLAAALGVDATPSTSAPGPHAVSDPGTQPAHEANTWMLLNSAQPYLRFTAGLWIGHHSTDVSTRQSFRIAQAAIHRRAEQVSRQFSILQADRLVGELTMALYDRRSAGMAGVSAWARCLEVRVDDEDREALQRYESAQRRLQVLGWQRDVAEQQLTQYQPLLTDPLRATAWWFVGHPEQTDQLPDVAEKFNRLRDLLQPVVTDDLIDEPEPDTLGRIVDEFAAAADPPACGMLTDHLGKLFTGHGRADLAGRIPLTDGPAPPPPPMEPG